ncbi:MAG: FecR domain-containing protein [Candidatus Neomarinimicrobiota bacterium]
MKNSDLDDQLIASYLSDECTEEELGKIEEWLQKAPENRDYLRRYQEIWSTHKRPGKNWNTERLWSKIEERIQTTPNVLPVWLPVVIFKGQYRMLKIAASVLLVALLSYLSYMAAAGQLFENEVYVELTVPRGTQNKLTMMDGTMVTLDAGSTLSYPDEFSGGKREVTLKGEGYFEVASDTTNPFVVNTGDAVIQVLGTKFVVRNWPLDTSIQVAVREGKVGLRSSEDRLQDAVVISGGQVAAMLENGAIQPPESVEIDRYMGWLNRDIRFDDATLEEIIFHLERWYDVDFELADTTIGSERLTLHTEKKSVESIIEMIAVLTDLSYKRSGKTIFLSRS